MADRHLSTLVAGVRQVTLARDALDRIVARTDTDLATNTTSTTRYGFAGAGDAVSALYDTANNLIETTISLPGGVLYTKRVGTSTDVWSYPNIHGDVAATRVNGTVTAFNWDPYGNPVGNIPDNSAGTVDWGWLGQHQRTLDHPPGVNPVIEMGARVYQPDTGRFQQTDPIEDGTTTNPYGYVPDPINQYDLNGQWCMLGTIKTVGPDGKTHKKCRGRGIASAPVRYARDHWRTLAVFGGFHVAVPSSLCDGSPCGRCSNGWDRCPPRWGNVLLRGRHHWECAEAHGRRRMSRSSRRRALPYPSIDEMSEGLRFKKWILFLSIIVPIGAAIAISTYVFRWQLTKSDLISYAFVGLILAVEECVRALSRKRRRR